MAGYDAPDYQHIFWDDRGSPFWKTASGKKTYIPPLTAAQYHDDPKMLAWAKSKGVVIDYQTDPTTGQLTVGPGGVTNNATPGGGLFHERGTWDSNTGEWDTPINWGNILSMVIAGGLTAGAASALMGGTAAASSAASTAAATGSVDAGLAAGGVGAGIVAGEAGAVTGLAGSGFGAGAGLGATAVPTSLAGVGTAAGVGLGETAATTGLAGSGLGAAPTAGALASTPTASIGALPAGLPSGTGLSGVGGASTLSTVGKLAKVGTDIAGVGSKISDAAAAAGNQRRNEANFDVDAQRTYENALVNRAKLEEDQRSQSLKDIYRSSYAKNAKQGPNNARGLTAYSPEYLQSLANLEKQGTARLADVAQYDVSKLKPLETVKTKPAGPLENVGSVVGPVLSGVGTAAKLYDDILG